MNFTLPTLPYAKDALQPFLSAESFDFHHGKHHANYVNKLNELVTAKAEYQNLSLEEVIHKSFQEGQKPIFNNAAQHWNHSFFWNCLSPEKQQPGEKTLELIKASFESFERFQEQFTAAATTLFGSGWAWLTLNSDNKLEILSLSNAETPLTLGKKPLLTIDVWEHAYYIDYRNGRANFINKYWEYINWASIEGLVK